jgi:hypothetical protein
VRPSDLQAWLDRHAWTAYRLHKALNTPEQTVRDWLAGTRIPGAVPLALCELDRRRAEREGLGMASCLACGALAVEDDGQDDRYGCVLCGARVDP